MIMFNRNGCTDIDTSSVINIFWQFLVASSCFSISKYAKVSVCLYIFMYIYSKLMFVYKGIYVYIPNNSLQTHIAGGKLLNDGEND